MLPHRTRRATALGSALLVAGGVAIVAPTTAPAVAGAPTAAMSPSPRAVGSTNVGPAAIPAGFHLVAVGDVARAGGAQARTAALVRAHEPQALLLLGDLAYDHGSSSDYATYYAPPYGAFRAISWPVPGNHEYGTTNAAGYRRYFGVTGATWWARRAGTWLVIGLDSEQPASRTQRAWLIRTLTANHGHPTVVLWHRPRVSSGQHGNAADLQGLYAVVAKDRDVKLLLWGHDHDYQRMSLAVRGRAPITAMVVGTGGAELRPVTRPSSPRWNKRVIAGKYGVLDLVLGTSSFTWWFTSTDGAVGDRGTQSIA